MPTGIPKGKKKLTDEERKANIKTSLAKWGKSEKGKASQKKRTAKYNSTEKGKTNSKKRRDKPESKIKAKERAQTPKAKASEKISSKKYRESKKGKAAQKRGQDKFYKSEKGYLATRLKIVVHYSKALSNSDIPCCRCCGESLHDFLAIDHILGKKQMDSEPELLKLGYSSKLHGTDLHKWIIKNDYPKGFQILCQNCNFAKGMKKNNNKCPHEMK